MKKGYLNSLIKGIVVKRPIGIDDCLISEVSVKVSIMFDCGVIWICKDQLDADICT